MKNEVLDYIKNYVYNEEEAQMPALFPVGQETEVNFKDLGEINVPVFTNEFWTSKQRKGNSIHEISYRACFKPQLPHFFIELLTQENDIVYDPFSGRGTTLIEAALLGRQVISNDINPLSGIFTRPRLEIPSLPEVEYRLEQLSINYDYRADNDLSMFFHPLTEAEIVNLREYLNRRRKEGKEDRVDRWIRMVASNRLTGHSRGFFSVYTLPPNQAVSRERQIKINRKRNQEPEYRNTRQIIMKKTENLLKGVTDKEKEQLWSAAESACFLENDARHTPEIPSETVQLTVTSPPFLNVVQYSQDNWMRCWFNGIDTQEIEEKITVTGTLSRWEEVMDGVLRELFRITQKGGWVAFEVGEVNRGQIKLEDHIIPLGREAGFECAGVLLNEQEFTKTSNIWGVKNNKRGTNTNRIVLFHVPLD